MSQVKTAVIEDVLNERIWDGPHGRVFYYTLVLDNGERGEIGAKKQDAYHINDSLTYTAEHSERGWKFKRVNPDFQNGGEAPAQQAQSHVPAFAAPRSQSGGGRGSDASFALSYAKDFIGKAMEIHRLTGSEQITTNQWVEAVLVTAAKFNAFLKENNQ